MSPFPAHPQAVARSGLTRTVIAAARANIDYVTTITEVDVPTIDPARRHPRLARRVLQALARNIGMDYVVTARSKGLTERAITRRHVLRNASLPVVTMAGVQVGNLLGGSVVVETVFGWPGIGLLAFRALFARDLNLLLGIFFVAACLVIVVNIVVDVIYSVLDPRIRLQ